MNKAELRKIYLSKQKNLSPEERIDKSRAIADRFFSFFDLSPFKNLHVFIAIERFNEIETSFIFQKIWREQPQIETLAPRVNFQTGEIENLKFSAETKFAVNSWQISEPAHDESLPAEKLDLVLLPLLCCDREGLRVGYGKGFYDKLLSRCRPDCVKIGLSYFSPIENISDANEYDVKLNYCVTPGNTYEFSG
jgi:5-formyltetrahydrofolate cyclo-ligase